MIEDSSLREKSLNCDNLTKRMRLNTNSTEDKQISNTKSEKSFSVKLPIINANLKANHYNDSNEVKARSNLERFELKVKDMKSKRYFDVYYKNSQKQDNIRNKDTSKPKQIILSKHTLRKLPLSTLVPENPTHSIILETKSFKNPRKELCKSMQILHESSTPVEIQKRRCASESLRSKSFENLKIEIERNPLNANTCKRINKFVPTPVDNKNRSNKHMLLSRENNVNVKISAKKDNTLTGSRSRSYNTYLINKNENKEIQASNLGLKYVKSNVMSTIKEIRERSPQINSSSVIIPLLKRLTKIKKLQTEYLVISLI